MPDNASTSRILRSALTGGLALAGSTFAMQALAHLLQRTQFRQFVHIVSHSFFLQKIYLFHGFPPRNIQIRLP